MDKRAAGAEICRAEAVRAREAVEARLEEMIGQVTVIKEEAAAGEKEQSLALHNLQASRDHIYTLSII